MLARASPRWPPRRSTNARVERGDGLQRLKAQLPPPERRGLTFIDPPYEETQRGFRCGHRRSRGGLGASRPAGRHGWYPIKESASDGRLACRRARTLAAPLLVSELWLFPRDSRVALNGSGLLIVNPPHRCSSACSVAAGAGGGVGDGLHGAADARMLSQSSK